MRKRWLLSKQLCSTDSHRDPWAGWDLGSERDGREPRNHPVSQEFWFPFGGKVKPRSGHLLSPLIIKTTLLRLCLAFVQSNFNISKVNENTDGSFDYGIFQINSHYWCNDHKSHSENLCDVDCQELLSPNLLSTINCAKKIVSSAGGMKNWVGWRLHCSGRPLSYWMTGCHLG
nr:lysozyme-like protein 6 isoform X1 [Equus caballus]